MEYFHHIVFVLLLMGLEPFFRDVSSNPFLGIVDPNCFIAPEGCPNQNVTFWLYTNDTLDSPKQLDPRAVNPWDFQPRRPLKILLHGYTGNRDFMPNSNIRPALLTHADVYVISVDYGPLVKLPCYFAGVQNLPRVSECLAQLINNLVDQNIVENDDIHLIGFSLGAQVAGQTANYVKRKLKHITGLDPAKPMFITASDKLKLDALDADFVDVIHTDVLGRGMLRSMGHVDFYPNMGPYQPGCREENSADPGSCNHERAPRYYAESIRNPESFWSYACPSWVHFVFGLCGPESNDAVMGYNVNKSMSGSFFLRTASADPFGLGPYDLQLTPDMPNTSLKYYNAAEFDDHLFEPQLHKAFIEYTEHEILKFQQSLDVATATSDETEIDEESEDTEMEVFVDVDENGDIDTEYLTLDERKMGSDAKRTESEVATNLGQPEQANTI